MTVDQPQPRDRHPAGEPIDDRGVRQRVDRLADYFETLNEEAVVHLGRFYHQQVRFKDPFNDVTGLAEMARIFTHMFRQVDEPRFRIHTRLVDGQQALLTWDFLFRFQGQRSTQTIHGSTLLRLGPDGLVIEHLDYWDAAGQLYAKLPVVGALIRWLQKRAAG